MFWEEMNVETPILRVSIMFWDLSQVDPPKNVAPQLAEFMFPKKRQTKRRAYFSESCSKETRPLELDHFVSCIFTFGTAMVVTKRGTLDYLGVGQASSKQNAYRCNKWRALSRSRPLKFGQKRSPCFSAFAFYKD